MYKYATPPCSWNAENWMDSNLDISLHGSAKVCITVRSICVHWAFLPVDDEQIIIIILYLLLCKNLEDYNAQVLIILQNWLRVSELITERGREFHNLTVEGKKARVLIWVNSGL